MSSPVIFERKPSAEVKRKRSVMVDGFEWPAFDHNPAGARHKMASGLPALDLTVELCERHRTVVQAGGNVGVWPVRLAKWFTRVLTFEPTPETFHCLRRNVVRHLGAGTCVEMYPSALGSYVGTVMMRPSVSAGTWRVMDRDAKVEGLVEVPITTIDAAQLTDCDAIILDIEGHEVEALRGAAETIARCHPVIHVEMLPRSADRIASHIAALGYRLARSHGGDRIYEYIGARR